MSSVFDKYYKRYDAWFDLNKFVYLSELRALKKALPDRGKGLEIGVGTGRFAAELGIKFGIDPSKEMLEIARKRGINGRLGKGEKLPFKNSVFDYALIMATLCFVKRPRKVLAEARRVLKKKGRIIIGIIDRDSFLGKFYRKKKSVFYKKANFFGVRETADLLDKIGFSRISYYQTLYKMPDEIKSVQKPKKGFGKGAFVVFSAYKTGKDAV